MPVSASFRTFVVDQLSRIVPAIRTRPMFGGVGIYEGDHFFALIADDTVYFKVDDSTRGDFVKREMSPFVPHRDTGESVQYYALAGDLLDDVDELRIWVEKAVAVARRAKTRRSPRTRKRRS